MFLDWAPLLLLKMEKEEQQQQPFFASQLMPMPPTFAETVVESAAPISGSRSPTSSNISQSYADHHPQWLGTLMLGQLYASSAICKQEPPPTPPQLPSPSPPMAGEQQQSSMWVKAEEKEEDNRLLELIKLKEQRRCQDLLNELLAIVPLHQPSSHFFPSFSDWLWPISTSSSPCGTASSLAASSPSQTFQCQDRQPIKKATKKATAPSPGERPHKCDQCQKAFRFKSNLFEHKSLHLASGHRTPFVCPFCAKTCRLKGNLKKHLQIHVTSVQDLERLWKRSFSRQSGRPRKDALPAPLPKPGDDLGLVPVLMASSTFSSSSSSSSSMKSQVRHSPGTFPPIQWTFADQPRSSSKMNITSQDHQLFSVFNI